MSFNILLFISLACLLTFIHAQTHVIQTIAGGLGDGIPAKDSSVNWPFDVSIGPVRGEYFIADTYNHRIRKVLTNGTIITIAGTGYSGFNGDGIPAIQAFLYYPYDVSVNEQGEVFIADTYNQRIRKVLTNGTIITVAGMGIAGYSGDGMPAINSKLNYPHGISIQSNGDMLISDTFSHRIRKVFSNNGTISTIAGNGVGDEDGYGKYNGDNMLATLASLNLPTTVAVNSLGEMFIADTSNHRVRKVSNDGIITTFAGTGVLGFSGDDVQANSTRLNGPNGVAVDSNDNVIIADRNNNRIRKVSNSGIITTIAGNGTAGYFDGTSATSSMINRPADVILGYDNELIIADTNNYRIRTIKEGKISTLAGTGFERFNGDRSSSTTLINHPSAMAFQNGELYFTDRTNHLVRKIKKDGTVQTIAGTGFGGYNGDNILATDAHLNYPHGVTVDSIGNVYISDSYNHRIRKIFTNGTIVTCAGTGTAGFNQDGIPATSSQLNYPFGITINGNDELLIADRTNNRLRKVLKDGTIQTLAGTGASGYNGDSIPAKEAKLYLPHGVSVDLKGEIYIADRMNHRIRKVSSVTGQISTIAGTGTGGFNGDGKLALETTLNSPYDVTVGRDGEIYIADTHNHRIRKILTNGNVTSIAGTGIGGFNRDGILSTESQLYYPYDVSIDPSSGKIYIGDSSNFRIRVLHVVDSPLSSPIPKTSVSGNGQPLQSRVSNASSLFQKGLITSIFILMIFTMYCM